MAGLALTWHAIEKNTESNLVASRAQLYETEHVVLSREFEKAGGKLLSMYAKPKSSVQDPVLYCEQRMKPLLASITADFWTEIDANGQKREPVDVLYDKFYGLEAFADNAAPHVAEMRAMYAHMGTVLDHMHSAYDFDQAIKDPEFSTWKGYIDDIGAHPIFIVTIKSWKQQGYLSYYFAEFLQSELRRDPLNRKVVDYFYPEMKNDSFLSGLQKYGVQRKSALLPPVPR